MKYAETRPYADPEKAARKLLEIASTIEPAQDGRIYVELVNAPFLFKEGGSPAEYKAGLELAIARGWLWKHGSGTYVKFTQAGAGLSLEAGLDATTGTMNRAVWRSQGTLELGAGDRVTGSSCSLPLWARHTGWPTKLDGLRSHPGPSLCTWGQLHCETVGRSR